MELINRLINKCLFILLLVCVCPFYMQAQKVGLVLSGGGARGVAHIGVIKALEEHGIPIDYIAGTSIGAIVGGLYAAGYSPDEMVGVFTNKEFANWVSGKISEEYIYYFLEGDANPSWFDMKFRLENGGIKTQLLPSSIIAPYQMDFAFMQIFASANSASQNNFDSLFVPFRCVAADIADNRPLTLRDGDLGRAVRASMTFPFYFKPIRINGKLLFDGGMYNNFPADVMQQDFHPDVIIGSKVANNYDPPQADDVISQIQNMLMEKTDYSVLDSGLLIEPGVQSVNVIDFSHTRAFLDSGYVAASRKIDQIGQHIKRRVNPNEVDNRRKEFLYRKEPLIIDTIYTRGVNGKQSDYVLHQLINQRREYTTLEEIKHAYFKLVADDKIANVYPLTVFNQHTGYYDLYLDMKVEKDINLKIGGNISSGPINGAYFGFNYRLLTRNAYAFDADVSIGRFYSSARLATRIDFPGKRPVYLQGDISFNQWDYFKTTTYFFEDKEPSYLIQNDNNLGIEWGLPLGNTGRLKGQIRFARIKDIYYQRNVFTRKDTADHTFFDIFSTGFCFDINSLNRKQYASSGVLFNTTVKYITGTEKHDPGSTARIKDPFQRKHDWFQARLRYDNYFNRWGAFRFGLYLEALVSNRKLFDNYTASMLAAPAFEPIPESKTLFMPQFRANNYGGGGLKVIYELVKNLELRAEGYVFQPYREILLNPDQTPALGPRLSRRYYMGSSTLVLHTPIGPLSLALNYFDQAQDPFSFIFNFGYILFNHRSTR